MESRRRISPCLFVSAPVGVTSFIRYTSALAAWNDCDGNVACDAAADTESAISSQASATAQ